MIAIAAILAAGAVQAGPIGRPVVTRPDWLHKPSVEEIESRYPALMRTLGIEGQALILCQISITGDAENCKIAFETPRRLGFGQAALSMAPLLKFKPQTVDGKPVGGVTIRVPITFALDTDEPAQSFSAMPRYDGDPKSKELARRLSELLKGPNFSDTMREYVERLAASLPSEGDPAARRRMLDSFEDALAGYEPMIAERRAALCADLFTPAQMQDIITFLETDSGRALLANLAVMGPQLTKAMNSAEPSISADALKAYCAGAADACPTRPALHVNGGQPR